MSNRVVSVVSVPSGRWGYYAPAIYEAVPRKADGALTWRCVGWPLGEIVSHGHRFKVGHRSKALTIKVALDTGLPYRPEVRHGRPVV